jgi:flagellar FliJ protein
MKKFKFKYEALLKSKEDLEKKLSKEFSEFIKERDLLVEKKEATIREKIAYEKSIEEKLRSGCQVYELREIEGSRHFFKSAIEKLENDIKKMQVKIDRKRNELIEASKEKKTYEILKEKDFKSFIDKIEEEDRKLIDNIVVYMASKKGDK